MRILSIDHVQLAMPKGGEQVARWFYEGVLGLSEVTKPPHLAARGGCWFEANGVRVHLGVEEPFSPARKAHPAFVVNDLEEVVAAVLAAGCSVVEDQPLEGFDRRYVYDPFGNRIEVMQPRSGEQVATGAASG